MKGLAPLLLRHLAVYQRQLHVLEHRHVADQIEGLEHETNFLVAQRGALVSVESRRCMAVQQILSTGGAVEQADDRKQCGFSAARGAGYGHVFALVDRQ
ncbi:MAG: hypothetical protein RQ899_14945 [Pseudomonadales bacterium]|nr:hypothetical protein [Pseudomonadales bacterium]